MHNGATNFIDGQWLTSVSGDTFPSVDPGNHERVLGTYARSGSAEVKLAVEAASRAYRSWRATPAPARGALISRMGEILAANKEDLAHQISREMGKVLIEARGDVQEAIDMARYIGAFGRMPDGYTVPSERQDVACFARRVPVGVVAMITPWNFPVAIPAWKMFPALVTGNTVVMKPSEESPGVAVAFVQMLTEAGIPRGVVNLLTGFGREVGKELIESPHVSVVSFTGSTATGTQIMERCATLGKRVSCEMGGKNGIIVLEDADLELAVKGAIWSAFGTTGQRCTAASRLIVHKAVIDSFTNRLLTAVQALAVGQAGNDAVDIGPVINEGQVHRIHNYVQRAIDAGAKLLCGGARPVGDAYSSGSFYEPTVLAGVTPDMEIAQVEVFGPVTVIMKADSFEGAIDIANSTNYGLSLSVYTRSSSLAFRAIELLDAGLTYINLPTSGAEIQLPFGGTRKTGNGHREAGLHAADYCTEWKASYINYSETSDLVRAQIDV